MRAADPSAADPVGRALALSIEPAVRKDAQRRAAAMPAGGRGYWQWQAAPPAAVSSALTSQAAPGRHRASRAAAPPAGWVASARGWGAGSPAASAEAVAEGQGLAVPAWGPRRSSSAPPVQRAAHRRRERWPDEAARLRQQCGSRRRRLRCRLARDRLGAGAARHRPGKGPATCQKARHERRDAVSSHRFPPLEACEKTTPSLCGSCPTVRPQAGADATTVAITERCPPGAMHCSAGASPRFRHGHRGLRHAPGPPPPAPPRAMRLHPPRPRWCA